MSGHTPWSKIGATKLSDAAVERILADIRGFERQRKLRRRYIAAMVASSTLLFVGSYAITRWWLS